MTKIQRNPAYKKIHTNKDKRYVIITGGRGCFNSEQLVKTCDGVKKISELKKGDEVFSVDTNTGEIQKDEVTYTHVYNNEHLIKVKLKDGTEINCTPDHKFFFRGEWLQIQAIITIFDEWKKNGK